MCVGGNGAGGGTRCPSFPPAPSRLSHICSPPHLVVQWSADSSTVVSGVFSVGTTTCSGNSDYTFTRVPTNGTCTVATYNGQPMSSSAKVYKAPAYTPPAPTTSGASETATAAAAVVGAAAAIAMAARAAY